MRRILLSLPFLLPPLLFALPALAGNWGEDWGTMTWGAAIAAVPTMGKLGLLVLVLGLGGLAARAIKRSRVAASLLAVGLVAPMLAAMPVAADPVGPLNAFANGTPADAVEVNENFEEVKMAVDDNYDRTIVAQQTADGAVAGHTVDTNTQLSESQVDGFIANNGYALATEVLVNAGNVQTNATNIQTNTTNISTNTTDIATNTTNIATNTTNAVTLGATLAAIQAFLCGDGAIVPGLESCDDGNSAPGDGCSQTCTIEPTFVCSGLPSVCSLPGNVRFIACSDGLSVEDTATGLLWERKLVGDANNVSVNDVNNSYSWSADIASTSQDGTVFTDFLAQLNTNVFGGQGNWRLPSVGEMQSILIGEGVLAVISTDPTSGLNPTGQSTICDSTPCIDPHFLAHAGTASPSYPVAVNGVTAQVDSIAQLTTGALPYWSSQSFPPEVSNAYGVNFGANARLPFTVQTPLVQQPVPFGIQLIRKDQGAAQPPSDRREVAVFARAVRSGSCSP
ncbi:MAG: DUF1566 domain-containing protein [Myxococcota bacterium]|nr:DUF1566 domain-containing protein [Myxococcota bacterium]